jgi:isoamyl acetate esterase
LFVLRMVNFVPFSKKNHLQIKKYPFVFGSDGLHLSEEGSNIVVEEILKVVKEADWDPCLHWKALPTEFAEDSPYDLVSSSGETTVNPSEWTIHRTIPWDG